MKSAWVARNPRNLRGHPRDWNFHPKLSLRQRKVSLPLSLVRQKTEERVQTWQLKDLLNLKNWTLQRILMVFFSRDVLRQQDSCSYWSTLFCKFTSRNLSDVFLSVLCFSSTWLLSFTRTKEFPIKFRWSEFSPIPSDRLSSSVLPRDSTILCLFLWMQCGPFVIQILLTGFPRHNWLIPSVLLIHILSLSVLLYLYSPLMSSIVLLMVF